MHECLFIVKIKPPNSKGFAFRSLWEVDGETELLQGNVNLLLGGWRGSCCTVGRAVGPRFHISITLPSCSQKIVLKMRPSCPLRRVMWEIKGYNVRAWDRSAKNCQQFGQGSTEAGIELPVKWWLLLTNQLLVGDFWQLGPGCLFSQDFCCFGFWLWPERIGRGRSCLPSNI